MSMTTVRLLKAAAEIVGGERTLAERLAISETLLAKFLADSRELPDALLLRAVDIILADRLSPARPAGGGLPEGPVFLQNWRRGSGAPS
jgi:hypothetical protein